MNIYQVVCVSLVVAAALLSATTPARSAEIRPNCKPVGRFACDIVVRGPIETGDARKVLSALHEANKNVAPLGFLTLASPGGDLREALKIADIVQAAMLPTTNIDYARDAHGSNDRSGESMSCASACFFIWLAGPNRFVRQEKTGRALGLHRPYFAKDTYTNTDPQTLASKHGDIAQAARQYLERAAVPTRLIEEMLRRPSTDIYWLTIEEENDLAGYAPWFEELLIARCNYDAEPLARLKRGGLSRSESDSLRRRFASPSAEAIQCEAAIYHEFQTKFFQRLSSAAK